MSDLHTIWGILVQEKKIHKIQIIVYIWFHFILYSIYIQSHGSVTVFFRCWTNCVWSWLWFQCSGLVLFRSFCGLGFLSNDYPGSPYPKKHLQGTLYNQEDIHKMPSWHMRSTNILWSQLYQISSCVYGCETVYLAYLFNTKGLWVL